MTQYGINLKCNYREQHGYTSLNGKNRSPYDYRLNVNNKFIQDFCKKDKQIMIEEIQTILNEILIEKECWLQTTGLINDVSKFNFKWYKQLDLPVIKDITISYKTDIIFDIILQHTLPYSITCILRFDIK